MPQAFATVFSMLHDIVHVQISHNGLVLVLAMPTSRIDSALLFNGIHKVTVSIHKRPEYMANFLVNVTITDDETCYY